MSTPVYTQFSAQSPAEDVWSNLLPQTAETFNLESSPDVASASARPQHQTQCRQVLLIPLKRAPRGPFDYLDKNEVDALFARVDTRSREGYRNLCILRTLYNTGARASELCALRLSDLDLAHKQVRLYGKGRKMRTVPLWDSTVALLRTYLKDERRTPQSAHRDFVFINQRRARLTRSGLYALCQGYLHQARREVATLKHKKIHPVHVWRSTTASHLLLAGVDLTVIQEWLGHAYINTTSRYKGISIETKRASLEKFYLFEKSWKQAETKGVDWSLFPDLLSFLHSL